MNPIKDKVRADRYRRKLEDLLKMSGGFIASLHPSAFTTDVRPSLEALIEERGTIRRQLDVEEQFFGNMCAPRIVCLCGSTRFYEEFQRANFRETMAGNIVLTVGFYPHAKFSKKAHGEDVGITSEEKVNLDDLHKRKIDLADEILVLNVGGYIGDSTRSEIEYARRTGKAIRWLEQPSSASVAEGAQLSTL
jgi:hypothetical protein